MTFSDHEANATQTVELQNPQLDEASDKISSGKGTSTLVAGSTSGEFLLKGLQSSQEVTYAVDCLSYSASFYIDNAVCTIHGQNGEVYGGEVKHLSSDWSLYNQNGEVCRGVWKTMSFDNGHTKWVFMPQGSNLEYHPIIIGLLDQTPQSYDQSNQYHIDANSLFDELKGKVWEYSQHRDGCLKVQEAFIKCCPDQRSTLAKELHGQVSEACKCPHANHVLQACIGFCQPSDFEFVIEEIMLGKGGALVVAKGLRGCRIICRLIEYANTEQIHKMNEDLVSHTVELSTHSMGNYVLQHLLTHSCDKSIHSDIIELLVAHLPMMEAKSFSCHLGKVLEKALFTSAENRIGLADVVVSDPKSLITMACTRWGTKAAALAFYLASYPYQEAARMQLMKDRFQNMFGNRYGKKLLDLVKKLSAGGSLSMSDAVKQTTPEASWESEMISKFCQ